MSNIRRFDGRTRMSGIRVYVREIEHPETLSNERQLRPHDARRSQGQATHLEPAHKTRHRRVSEGKPMGIRALPRRNYHQHSHVN